MKSANSNTKVEINVFCFKINKVSGRGRGIDFFRLNFGTVPTVLYFRTVPTVLYFRTVPTVLYFLFLFFIENRIE